MAEIHVETKKHNTNNTWIWIVVLLLIAAVVIYFVTRDDDVNENNVINPENSTSYIQQPQPGSSSVYYLKTAV
jgi:lipopolysaccharide export system protein LptC